MKSKIIKLNLNLCMVLAVILNTATAFSQELPDVLIEPFPILSWVPPAINAEQLEMYKDTGFTVLTIYPDEDVYREMKKHWDGNYILFKEWTERHKDIDNYSYDDMLAFRPDDEKKIGYLITDEPYYKKTPYSTHGNVLADSIEIVNKMREQDPHRISLVNLFPTYVGETRLGGGWLDYLKDYFEIMKPRYSSFDHYPLMWFDITRPTFYYDMEMFRKFAMWNNSKRFGFVQVFSKATVFRDVSESDLAWQVNTFLAYGCKGLWYFNFRHPHPGLSQTQKPTLSEDGVLDFRELPGVWAEYYKQAYTSFGPAVLDYEDKPAPIYDAVKQVNSEVAAWGPTLLKLENLAVRHTLVRQPFVPVGTEKFIPNGEPYISDVRAVKPDEDKGFIVSYFEDEEKTPYVMVVNKRYGEFMTREGGRTKTQIRFDQTVKNVYFVCNKTGKLITPQIRELEGEKGIEALNVCPQTGEPLVSTIPDNRVLTVDIDAGGAVLMRLDVEK